MVALPERGHAQITLTVRESSDSLHDEAEVLAWAIKGETEAGRLQVVNIDGPEDSIGAICGMLVHSQLLLAVTHIRQVRLSDSSARSFVEPKVVCS